MKTTFYDFGLATIIFIVGVAAIVGIISQRYLGDDNVVEEACEEVIDKETGVNIDLTPGTPEVGKAK